MPKFTPNFFQNECNSSLLFVVCLVAYECAGNTVYDPCFSGCEETCSTAASAQFCNATCEETCRCADGFVLDGGSCVDPAQCGCTLDNDLYIPVCVYIKT